MFKLSQPENFEIGSIFAFFSLAFYTVIPYLLILNFVYVPIYIYKILSGLFLIFTLYFYLNSSDFLSKQIKLFGIIFVLFGLFQLFFDTQKSGLSLTLKIIPILFGIILFFISFFFLKTKKNI